MNPTTLLIVQALLKYGPSLARELVLLFQKSAPTAADWEVIFKIAETPLEDPDVASIPPKTTTITTVTTTAPAPTP